MSSGAFTQFKEIDYEGINKRFLELIEKADDDAKKLLIEAFIQYMNANNGENSNNHAKLRESMDKLDAKLDVLTKEVTGVANKNETAVQKINEKLEKFMDRAKPFVEIGENLTGTQKVLKWFVSFTVLIGGLYGIPKLIGGILGWYNR